MRKYLLLCLSVSFLATGCVNDDNSDNYSFPLNIGSVSLNGLVTRSSTLLASEGATVSVSALSSGTVSATSQYTYTSGAWGASGGSTVLAPFNGTALCAYYPYSASITNKAAIPLTSASNVSTNDLSYGYTTSVSDASTGTSHATFALQHAYAQLTFSFSGGTGYAGSTVIGDVSICNPGIASSGSLNITQTPAVYTKVLSGVTFNAGITSIPTTGTREASVLMVPTDALSGDLSIVIKVGSDYKLLTFPVTYFANSKLEAGTNYQISVNLNAANGNISLGSTAVKTIDWVTGTAANNAVICDDVDPQLVPESNCYIVAPGAAIYIPVSCATTGNAANFPNGSSFTTGLLWSDVSATHVTAKAKDRYIMVVAGSTEGNSVVYAKNANGDIVWSWHIWVTNYNPSTTTMSYASKVWMDRNLGAKNSGLGTDAYGLYYQWGRKDPFPGGVGVNSSIMLTTFGSYPATIADGPVSLAASISNPNIYYMNSNNTTFWDWLSPQRTDLWDKPGKTIYDPCPAGWRVPLNTEFTYRTAFPAANNTPSGYWFNDGSFNGSGSTGQWWSGVTSSATATCFTITGFMYSSFLASGFSVRCVHE